MLTLPREKNIQAILGAVRLELLECNNFRHGKKMGDGRGVEVVVVGQKQRAKFSRESRLSNA